MNKEFKRILIKLSGEAFSQECGHGIDFDAVLKMCREIKKVKDEGYEIAIVIGGGNFWRGRSNEYMDSCTSDHIGMLGTIMNALALGEGFRQIGIDARVQTSIEMLQMAEFYITDRARKHLEKGKVVIFGGGTGNPFFSTDTAAALRAAELNADVIFKATNVDGVYDKDPRKNNDAVKYEEISYRDVLTNRLKVMDATAISLCMDNNIPIVVFNMNKEGNLLEASKGNNVGTIIK